MLYVCFLLCSTILLNCANQGIDFEAFVNSTNDLIKDLIVKIGDRAKFLKYFKDFKPTSILILSSSSQVDTVSLSSGSNCYASSSTSILSEPPDFVEDKALVAPQVRKKPFKIQDLESVNRIATIPIVESGWNIAENVYNRIKKSHTLVYWTLQHAESSFQVAIDTALPTIALFEAPISSLDKILNKGLDIVEQKVPSIALPPEMIYWNTKQYVTDVSSKIVKPVLKRADSVKQIGNTVLQSKYTAFAADTLDGALDVADKYVDKYLPAAVYDDQSITETDGKTDANANRAIQTIHHVGRFSGKLQRRLTKRTLIEAKALKEQSAEAIHVLIYVAELIVTDPKLALEKGKELWQSLSQDEPENQARPENLEQLIVLLTRESARRVVHLINFTNGILGHVPRGVSNAVLGTISRFLQVADSMVKSVHMDGIQRALASTLKNQAHHITLLLKQVNTLISELLDNVAQSLSSSPDVPKSALEVPKIQVQLRAVNRNKNSNGVDSNSN